MHLERFAMSKSLVSIPKRVLEALNLSILMFFAINKTVSIPKRVLEALNPGLNRP